MVRYAEDVPDDDVYEQAPPFRVRQRDIRRWNHEWARYLKNGWERFLSHHTDYPTPTLPADPVALTPLQFADLPLELYCDRDAIAGKRVMELGCGCGTVGKLIGRYCGSYLGTDISTLALQIGRLVSPPNCTYVQCADTPRLEPFFGTIDTVLARHFWIHQNLATGRGNLDYYARFLRPGGRAYLDFFHLDPARPEQDLLILPPTSRLSQTHPSATFQWTRDHLTRLLEGMPFTVLRDEVNVPMQRWYVVVERT
jgi:SAM-dependent methyltransferase